MRKRRDTNGLSWTIDNANDFVDAYGNAPRLPPEPPELTDEQLFAMLPNRWERLEARSKERR